MLTVDGLESRTDVVVRVAWRDGRTSTGVLRADTPELALPDGPATESGAVLRSYVGLGVAHILLGPDHLLFVLGLLLLADGWGMLVRTVTAFTAAHSLTLALAAFGLLALPPAPVDATIALSIVVLALELLRDPEAPRRWRAAPRGSWPSPSACCTASALPARSPRSGCRRTTCRCAPLLQPRGRAGQMAFVAAILPVVAVSRRVAGGRTVLARVPAYAIGALAVAWTLDRVLAFWTLPA